MTKVMLRGRWHGRWLPHQLRTVALRKLAGRIFIAIVNSRKTFTSIINRIGNKKQT
jgi:hypothetical protein